MSAEDIALMGDDDDAEEEGETEGEPGFDTDDMGWRDGANCLGVDPDLFFPERGASTKEAKGVCRGCVVREFCLEYAIATGEKFGIWGGLSERERRRIRRRRAIERKEGTYVFVAPQLAEPDHKAFQPPRLPPKPVMRPSVAPASPEPVISREEQLRLVQFILADNNLVVVPSGDDDALFARRFGMSEGRFFKLLTSMMVRGWIAGIEESEENQIGYLVTEEGLNEFGLATAGATAIPTQEDTPQKGGDQGKVGPAMATYTEPDDLDQDDRDILKWLADNGPIESSSGQATAELADQLSMDKSELSPIISAFVKAGLVDREGTQRPKSLAITDLGRQWLGINGSAVAGSADAASAEPAGDGTLFVELDPIDVEAGLRTVRERHEDASQAQAEADRVAEELIEQLAARVEQLTERNATLQHRVDELEAAEAERQQRLAEIARRRAELEAEEAALA